MEPYTTPPKAKSATASLDRFQVVKGNRGSARGELLDRFLARLNPAREAKGYKKYTHSRLSMMLQHIKDVTELDAFYKQCEKSDIPFSAYFHWSLKPKK